MKVFYGYIRVSTARQGEHGVSLEQQRHAIQAYSEKHGLVLTQWFEERETAAKRGRPVFGEMLTLLRSGKACGVIIHKIDRSARNLRDWADLGEMIDSGIEVHFANEALDLHSRGGRLSADIQAVVAADYIRNLREETKKGFYGRLKQGLYPARAAVGYLDQGSGKPKVPDPVLAPLVTSTFHKYASGRYSLDTLVDEMYSLGLRNKIGTKVTRNRMSRILNNPFYTGVIRLVKTGETFAGTHQPIVSSSVFERVKQILAGKIKRRANIHNYPFSQLVACARCEYSLIGERQKGHIYYRCHTQTCATRTIRHEALDQALVHQLKKLEFSQEEKDYFRAKVLQMRENWADERQQATRNIQLRIDQIAERQNRLTDAYLDGTIDKEAFDQRKNALVTERCTANEKLQSLIAGSDGSVDGLSDFLELAGTAYLAYKLGLPDEKRELVDIVTSNRTVDVKTPMFTLRLPFAQVAKRLDVSHGGPRRDIPLVWDALIPKLIEALPLQVGGKALFTK